MILPYIYDPTKLKEGGGIRYTHNLVHYLLKNKFKVSVLGVKLTEKQTNISPNFSFIPILDKSESWWKYFIKLTLKTPFFNFSKLAIVHTQRSYFMIPFILFYPTNPKICTLHMKPLEFVKVEYPRYLKYIQFIYSTLESFCLNKMDVCIAVSDEVKQAYLDNYPNLNTQIQVISGSGVDFSIFKPLDKKRLREKYGFQDDEIVVLFVGRLEKIKNIGFLIRSYALFSNKVANSKLVIVGHGSELNNLLELVNSLKINNVVFTGEISPEGIPEIYNCANISVLSSISESGPTVLVESLACGVPMVSTKVGNVCDIITDPLLGTVVDLYDENLFAESLMGAITLLSENTELSRTKCRDAALKKFSFECIGNRIVEVYQKTYNSVG